jgi:hypothetical protein
MYVTSDMACNQPNSATPMSQARITAQDNRVARVGSQFENGNAILSNLVQQLGGIGIGNPPGATPRTTTPTFVNSPACSTAVLTGGGIYGRRLPVLGGPTGQPILQPDGTIAMPSLPGAPATASTNGTNLVTVTPTPSPGQTSGPAPAAMGLPANVPGGSSPGVISDSTQNSIWNTSGKCGPAHVSIPAQPGGVTNPVLLWGGLILLLGLGALTGGNK